MECKLIKYFKIISVFIALALLFSCKNGRDVDGKIKTSEKDVSERKNIPRTLDQDKSATLNEIDGDKDQLGKSELIRPDFSIIKNLDIDTSLAFGIWVQDPSGPTADFLWSKESFYIADYDGDGDMKYILDKDKITIFYEGFIQAGEITSVSRDSLIIRWNDYPEQTIYVKFDK